MDQIRAVIFDIDDTLYDFSTGDRNAKEALFSYWEEHGLLKKEEAIALHGKIYQKQIDLLGDTASAHNRLIRYQMMLEEMKLPTFPHAMAMAELYWSTLMDGIVPEPGLVDLMKVLKERGISIGIGTNMTSMIQFKKLMDLGLTPYIDYVTTSEDAGVDKPDPAIFHRCVEKAGCKPSEAVFIGDSVHYDMTGATAAGLHPVQYQPLWKLEQGGNGETPYPVIRDYRDCLTEDGIRLGNLVI